jgi:hypothetical protein
MIMKKKVLVTKKKLILAGVGAGYGVVRGVRFPRGLWDEIADEAKLENRTTSAQIIHILERRHG